MKVNYIQYNSCLTCRMYTKNYKTQLSFRAAENNNINKTKRSKVKEFLIDCCIGWTVWDILSTIFKMYNESGKKPPFP